jgi:hypothetical protein
MPPQRRPVLAPDQFDCSACARIDRRAVAYFALQRVD